MKNNLLRLLPMAAIISILFSCCSKKVMVTTATKTTTAKAGTALVTYITGDAADVSPTPTPGLVLMGGSTDVDAAIQWLLAKANGGDVVVIRASGADGYNQYMYNFGSVNSVETIMIDSRTKAGLTTVSQKIRNAEALFIAGGDQWDYVNYWKNTPVEDAINYLLNTKKAPVGGTSAGLAVLGGAYYNAQNGSATSTSALSNPYDRTVTLGSNDFINAPYLQGLITDSHYSQRTRQGRHITFMARLMKDFGYTNIKGLGVDEQTAVCIDGAGMAQVYGNNAAYFLSNTTLGAETCLAKNALTWNRNGKAVSAYKITGSTTGNGSFNVGTWTAISGGTSAFYYVNNGVLF